MQILAERCTTLPQSLTPPAQLQKFMAVLAAQLVMGDLCVCSAMNVAEEASIVSSLDNDTPSQAESQDPLPDAASGRTGSLQDSQDGVALGEASNGSLPHMRKGHWTGAMGPPYQEPHPGAPSHLLHQHPHLVSNCFSSASLYSAAKPVQ